MKILKLKVTQRIAYKVTTKRNHNDDVNLQKSNVVVFRNGGHIAAREKWFYDGMKLEIVNQYKYLGVIFFFLQG